MKKLLMISIAALISFQMPGCKTKEKTTVGGQHSAGNIVIGDNSRNSLDWDGTYTGVLPCADCEGMLTTITLNRDLTFRRSTVYKGKDEKSHEESGRFTWDQSGGSIKLEGIANAPDRYLVGENKLVQLDLEGKVIRGELAAMYVLQKVQPPVKDPVLEGKKWKLVEINGKPVDFGGKMPDAFIYFDETEQRINGFGSCNTFFGSYELREGNRVTFSKMGSTMMSCLNMETERALLKVLETVDNYTVDDKSLQLNKARMAPLARFEPLAD